MKNLFDPARAIEIKDRLSRLRADSPRQWGTMTPAQVVSHCAEALRMGTGEVRPPRAFIGRLLGGFIKRAVLGNDEPFRKNSPTAKELVVTASPEFEPERQQLLTLIDRFQSAGPAGVTEHPHTFFGRMTGAEWGILMYKHLDHHLRQFAV